MTQAVARHMMAKSEGGSIVNVASAVGRRPTAGSMTYLANKAEVTNLTQGSPTELAASEIRVTAIAAERTRRRCGTGEGGYGSLLPENAPTFDEAQIALTPLGWIWTLRKTLAIDGAV